MNNVVCKYIKQANSERKQTLNVLLLSVDKELDLALCKTEHNFYKFKLEESGVYENRPENLYILPLHYVSPEVDYDLMIVGSTAFPQDIVQDVHKAVDTPIIQLNTNNEISDQGNQYIVLADDLKSFDEDFVAYWRGIIETTYEVNR
tara:strand:+ start:5450 stop:5890 length:441 start_codon:yes stop_codon:yes gene_type:complete